MKGKVNERAFWIKLSESTSKDFSRNVEYIIFATRLEVRFEDSETLTYCFMQIGPSRSWNSRYFLNLLALNKSTFLPSILNEWEGGD